MLKPAAARLRPWVPPAHHKCRAELARQAANFDAELVALQQEFCAIAREVHKDRLIRATEEALGERALNPGMLLH